MRTGTSPYNRAYNTDGEGSRINQNLDGASSNFIYDNDDGLTGIRGSIVADICYNANSQERAGHKNWRGIEAEVGSN